MKGLQRTIRRRRFEQKTDYQARLAMLSSGKPRVVVRKTNRYVMAQLVSSERAQDRIIVGSSSKDLLEHGWPVSHQGSLKSIPAAYLTGLLLAKKIVGKEAILDIGMHRNIKKGRIYAVLKGLIDGGISIPHGATSLPDEKTLEHNPRTREIFLKLKGALGPHGRKGNKE